MIADFEDFVTWMFVLIDDVWQEIAPLYHRPGPKPTTCSDSELITVALVSACRGWKHETQLVQEWAAYRRLIPSLPERSRFNRRRRQLMGAINQIRQIVLTTLDVAHDSHRAIDSLPIPVVQFHLAPQRSRDWDAHGATFGQCASKKQTFAAGVDIFTLSRRMGHSSITVTADRYGHLYRGRDDDAHAGRLYPLS